MTVTEGPKQNGQKWGTWAFSGDKREEKVPDILNTKCSSSKKQSKGEEQEGTGCE